MERTCGSSARAWHADVAAAAFGLQFVSGNGGSPQGWRDGAPLARVAVCAILGAKSRAEAGGERQSRGWVAEGLAGVGWRQRGRGRLDAARLARCEPRCRPRPEAQQVAHVVCILTDQIERGEVQMLRSWRGIYPAWCSP